ncbi:MAG: hypothetical protein GXO34_08010, partial [Deltaproteobacteria bacterium]|nr:hypothetical protein [Deltaproteobacteria bacterium]
MKITKWVAVIGLILVFTLAGFCRRVHALVVIPASVAGSVADSNGDGLGDNHTADLSSGAPAVVAAGLSATGGGGSNGTVRIQIEWDLQGFVGTFARALVHIHTYRGTVDALDTYFYHGSREQDGLLRDSDFEAP